MSWGPGEGGRRVAVAVAVRRGRTDDGTVPRSGQFRLGALLGPWIVQRVRGSSSGDGRLAKRPRCSR